MPSSSDFPPPTCVAPSKEMARGDMGTCIDASEYMDSDRTLDAKVERLAAMIRSSTACCAYTGAGLSTSAGIGDYASKAKNSAAHAWDPHSGGGPHMEHLKEARPTAGHRVLAGLERAGLLHQWVNQNHDGLDMKATFPLAKLNQIHGSWFDARNPVVAMDGAMRDDLDARLDEWAEKADLVLALGTTLSGLRADMLAERVAARAAEARRTQATGGDGDDHHRGDEQCDTSGGAGGGLVGGLVIVALTKTPLDDAASLRIYARLDDVLGRLAARLRLPLPTDAEVAKASKRSTLWHEYALWYRDVHDKMLERDDRHAGGDANKGKAIKGRRRESEYETMRRAQPSNPSLAGLRRKPRVHPDPHRDARV